LPFAGRVGDVVGLNLLKGADGIIIKSSLLDHKLAGGRAEIYFKN
jgi:hypothetical protein